MEQPSHRGWRGFLCKSGLGDQCRDCEAATNEMLDKALRELMTPPVIRLKAENEEVSNADN